MMSNDEHIRPYAYESQDWLAGVNPAEVIAFWANIEHVVTESGYRFAEQDLGLLSQFAISLLTTVDSAAFQQPMGQSIVRAWTEKQPQRLFVGGKEEALGFITVDTTLVDQGIHYLDIAATYPPLAGLGKQLLNRVIGEIKKTAAFSSQDTVVLARTQNPAAAMAIRSALLNHDASCFPIDRDLNEVEQEAVHTWLEKGHFRLLGSGAPKVDVPKGIFHGAYVEWRPIPPEKISEGTFQNYLSREGINYRDFVQAGNAFMIGGSFPSKSQLNPEVT